MLEQLSQPVAFSSAPLFDEGEPVHISPQPKIPTSAPKAAASGGSDTDVDEPPPSSPLGFFATASAWAAKRRGSDSTVKGRKSGSRAINPEDPGDLVPDDDGRDFLLPYCYSMLNL